MMIQIHLIKAKALFLLKMKLIRYYIPKLVVFKNKCTFEFI